LKNLQTPDSELIIRLYPDQSLKQQLHEDTNYNIFVIDQNGQDQRVDSVVDFEDNFKRPERSRISFYRGHVLEDASSPTGQIFAIGYIDPIHKLISLQAFIQYDNVLLYLRPNTGMIAGNSTNTNLHQISNETTLMGSNFFELFQKQFIAQQQHRTKRAPIGSDEVEGSCRKSNLPFFCNY